MKTAISLLLILAFLMPAHAESLELLKAKYDTEVSKRKAKVEAAIFQRMISQKGIIYDATDYYKTGLIDKKYNKKKKESEARVNQLRGEGKTNTPEYYKALNEFYTFQKMEYKELSANLEKQWYDSVSYWAVEGMKGSWNDAKLVVGEVWAKKWDLLKTLMDKGVSEAVKSLIYETIDATYKVRFVDYVIHNHGATKKIAEYWWDHFIMGNFKKSKTMELIEDIVSKGQEKIQEKLEEKVKERVKDELIKKGEQLAKDELEKKTKEAAEGFIRNLITVPSILLECAAKYYNVIDFNLMFLQAAPNEANYLNNEIKRVLKELGKLNDDEINKCYFDSDYFMSLREQVGGKKAPPKLTKKEKPKNPKTKIKIRVKSNLQPAIETAWEYYDLEDKVKKQIQKTVEPAPASFDVQPFIALLDAAADELNADAIDYPGFMSKVENVKRFLEQSLNAWGGALFKKSAEQGKPLDPKEVENKKSAYTAVFNRSYDSTIVVVDKELNQYHQQIKAAAEINLGNELKILNESIASKITAFNAAADARSIALTGAKYLAPSKPSNSISDLLSDVGTVKYCFFYKAILNPNSSTGQFYQGFAANGHIHNAVIILMAGEWFSKSLYDIWHTGYHGSMQLKNRIDQQWQNLYKLLNPEKKLWRVYYIDKNGGLVYQKDVAAIVNNFRSRSKSKTINQIYAEYAKYTGFVYDLLKKNEKGIEISLAGFECYKARLETLMAEREQALGWINTDGKALSDKNFGDWKTMSRNAAELVARLIANEVTIDDFKKETILLTRKREEIQASQYYVAEMAKIEKVLTRILGNQQNSIFLKLAAMYSAYFAKYTVPEKAVFEQLTPFSSKIETALQKKVTTEFSSTRINNLNRKSPGYCTKDLVFDLRKCNVRFEQREFYRLFVWEISYGLLENLTKLEKIYEQAVNAQNQVNQWLTVEYDALYQKAEAAQNKKTTIEEYQALTSKLDSLGTEASLKFWNLMKSNRRYVSIKYTEENSAMVTKMHKVLLIINRSF